MWGLGFRDLGLRVWGLGIYKGYRGVILGYWENTGNYYLWLRV